MNDLIRYNDSYAQRRAGHLFPVYIVSVIVPDGSYIRLYIDPWL